MRIWCVPSATELESPKLPPRIDRGQAHDMFSRIFRIRIYDICFDIFKSSKLRKMSLLTNTICLFFQLRNIGKKIDKFVLEKFGKPCREPNNSWQTRS